MLGAPLTAAGRRLRFLFRAAPSQITQALEFIPRLVTSTPQMFGARRTEQQPWRLRSPKFHRMVRLEPRFREIDVQLNSPQDFVIDYFFIPEFQDSVAFLLQSLPG